MQVTPQSQQYGLPDKGTRTLPTAREVADLMRAPGIPHGTMSRNKTAAGGVDPRMDDAPTLREHQDRDWKRLEDEADTYYADPHHKPYGPLHQASSGDWVHAHELSPGDLVSWQRGSGRGPGDGMQRGRVEHVGLDSYPDGSGGSSTVHIEGQGSITNPHPPHPGSTGSFYRHNFD